MRMQVWGTECQNGTWMASPTWALLHVRLALTWECQLAQLTIPVQPSVRRLALQREWQLTPTEP